MKRKLLSVLILAALAGIPLSAQEHWVATWATSPPLARVQPPPASPTNPNPTPQQTINTRGFTGQTVRMMVRASIGGHRLRVKFANAFGAPPVEIGAAHIAIRAKDSEIVAGSDRAAALQRQARVASLGPGVVLLSDPVDLDLRAPRRPGRQPLLPRSKPARPHPWNGPAHHLHFRKVTSPAQPAIANPLHPLRLHTIGSPAIDVAAPAEAAAHRGLWRFHHRWRRTPPPIRDHSWPALLAARLATNRRPADIGVANMGIGGNRVLHDSTGASALAVSTAMSWPVRREVADAARRHQRHRPWRTVDPPETPSLPTTSSAATSRSSTRRTITASR